jgi:membrane protease subunit (stomatin/prohibitin family)
VREGQVALFVNEGSLADTFESGLHRLDTANLPILTSLMNWDKGFPSPFKSDVVFLSFKEQQGLKWAPGSRSPYAMPSSGRYGCGPSGPIPSALPGSIPLWSAWSGRLKA